MKYNVKNVFLIYYYTKMTACKNVRNWGNINSINLFNIPKNLILNYFLEVILKILR